MKKIFHKSRKAVHHIKRSKFSKKVIKANEIIIIFVLFIAIFSYLTNPFTQFNVIREPFKIDYLPNGQMSIAVTKKLYLVDNPILRSLGDLKSTWHIFSSSIRGGGKGSKSETLDGIINDIHTLRFNPKEPYIISGDHFSVLYPRSLGIFYNTILDPRTARSAEDWKNRQEIYLQTTLYVMLSYQNATRLSTTITPTGPLSVTLNNYFDPPSDTMYSILYALRTLETSDDLSQYYPFPVDSPIPSLQTTEASRKVVGQFKPALARLFNQYLKDVRNPTTGLVRTDKSFSGAKDSVIRFSSFYDNVILWKTIDLANTLHIISIPSSELDTLKNTIISTFWLPDEGYFLEDLSDIGKKEKHYSSDWLIAVMTGFLSAKNPQELEYIKRSVDYIHQQKLHLPFALKYQPAKQQSLLHWALRVFAPTYGTQAIWSHWGMEYIKVLNILYQRTCEEEYLTEAGDQIRTYSNKIISSHGYPELYDPEGRVFKNPFYKSVYQTGWVVNFEQADMMTKKTTQYKNFYCGSSPNKEADPRDAMM